MQAFTNSHTDPLTAAAAGILFNEDLSAIQAKVKELAVGDKTNFGVITKISNDSIEFKARDTGKTTIQLKQRKIGSKDFVLDKLMKLKESSCGEDEEDDDTIEEENVSPALWRKVVEMKKQGWVLQGYKGAGMGADIAHMRKDGVSKHFSSSGEVKWPPDKKNEETELEEGINFAAVAKAKKDGMSDAKIDSFVKIHKANGRSDKEISAMLMSGKGLKEADESEEEELDEAVYTPKGMGAKKAFTIVTELDDVAEFVEFMKGLSSYYVDYAKQNEQEDSKALAKHLFAAYNVVKTWH